jgi:hypothetical protein
LFIHHHEIEKCSKSKILIKSMGKKIVVILTITLFCNSVFSQAEKLSLFIGTYDKNDGKGFMCHDRALEREDVVDYKEYEILRVKFREKYKTQNPGTEYVRADRAVIIYENDRRRAGWNCTIRTIGYQEGRDLKSAQEALDKWVAKFPEDYQSKPSIFFSKEAIPMVIGPGPSGYTGYTGSSGNSGNSGSSGSSGSSGILNKNRPCPTYGFKFNAPSYNCVALEWWSLSKKTNMVDAAGNFKQSSDPEAKSFTIEFRKQGDVYWTSEKRENSGRNIHTLSGLDACTKYEVRLTATCDNNEISAPTNVVRFTTACKKPGNLTVENITSNSAKVRTERITASITHPCSSQATTQIAIIEFKSNTGVWNELICNSGAPCFLNALNSGTIYRVRARFKYGNNLYSNYTNEVSFTTTNN